MTACSNGNRALAMSLSPPWPRAMPDISADGLTYTFTLKDGIKFGDGTDLTAQVYADSMIRTLKIGPDCPNGVAGALGDALSGERRGTGCQDDRLPLEAAGRLLPAAGCQRHVYGGQPEQLPGRQMRACIPTPPVYGTGPWFVSQFVADQQIVFEPNPYYTGEFKPQVKQVIVRFFSDPQTEALAVQNGEIDIAWRYLGR